MKKWATIIIFSLIAIFLMIPKANALNVDYNTINTNNIDSLAGYTGNYVIVYSLGGTIVPPATYLIFLNSTTAYIEDRNVPNIYINDVCSSEGGCFTRIYATKSSNPKLGYIYTSNDYGNTWNIYSSATNWISTDPLPSPYIIYTTANLYGLSSGNPLKYAAGYHYIDAIDIDSLPHMVYNLSVLNTGNLKLTYYFDTPNTSGVNLIVCFRTTIEGVESTSCTVNFTQYEEHYIEPIYYGNTYYITYEDRTTGTELYRIELNIADYIESLPSIQQQDLKAEMAYYNHNFDSDSAGIITTWLDILSTPINFLMEIVQYFWLKLNVYMKMFLSAGFCAMLITAIIRYIK